MNPRFNAPVIDIEIQLRGQTAARLEAEAKRRNRPPAELLADVIEMVIGDNLFDAVLDTGPDTKSTARVGVYAGAPAGKRRT